MSTSATTQNAAARTDFSAWKTSATPPKTQEMLDFCGKHNIVSDIEIIDMQGINEAYERMLSRTT